MFNGDDHEHDCDHNKKICYLKLGNDGANDINDNDVGAVISMKSMEIILRTMRTMMVVMALSMTTSRCHFKNYGVGSNLGHVGGDDYDRNEYRDDND